jgi:hypothetical protein
MKRDIFEIRGNINPLIKRLEQLEREREEREKAERDARYERERLERERKEAEWKANHPILDKFTYINSWNYETYSWPGDYFNIRFYEWSNIESEPRFFSHSIAFYRFLDDCKINLTSEQNNKIKMNPGCHITCIPGTHDIIIGTSYDSLRSQFNTAKVLAPVPELETTSNVPAVVNKEDNKPKVLSCAVYDGPKDYA